MVRAIQRATAPPVRFGGTAASVVPEANAFLRTFDFEQVGKSTVRQNMLMYSLVIASRLIAAAKRGHEAGSYNEVREHALRDILGWTFWFFAAGQVQRLFLRFFPAKYRDVVVQNPYRMDKTAQGVWPRLKERFKWEFNFLVRGKIPTAEQLEQRMEQFGKELKKSAEGLGKDAVEAAEKDAAKYFRRISKLRNLASFTGISMAIALLGIGIPWLNILVTRKNVAERQKQSGAPAPQPAMQQPAPAAPGGFASQPYYPSYL